MRTQWRGAKIILSGHGKGTMRSWHVRTRQRTIHKQIMRPDFIVSRRGMIRYYFRGWGKEFGREGEEGGMHRHITKLTSCNTNKPDFGNTSHSCSKNNRAKDGILVEMLGKVMETPIRGSAYLRKPNYCSFH